MKALQVPLGRLNIPEENGIVPPDHPLLSDSLRQLLKHRNHDRILVRQPRLHVLSVGREGKLEIIRIGFQRRKHWKHRRRVLRPQNNSVHILRRKGNPPHLPGIPGIFHKHKAFLQAVSQPSGIKSRNIRPSAGADYHGSFSPFVSFILEPELKGLRRQPVHRRTGNHAVRHAEHDRCHPENQRGHLHPHHQVTDHIGDRGHDFIGSAL